VSLLGYKVIAGDFPTSATLSILFGQPILQWGWGGTNTLNLIDELEKIELVTEENQKKFIGAAGWGLVGGVALGPLGLLAGVLAGGNKKKVCFACYLKDGRKFMIVTDQKTYQKMLALTF
jgi:hypothetical protein